MDIDNADIDSIACKFRTMNTNDKDHLIAEFKRCLSSVDVSDDICCFYLDMAEWNLNSALWAFYEYETSNGNGNWSSRQATSAAYLSQLQSLPQMRFVCDVTNGEGESIPPNTAFYKTWRIANTGNTIWPVGCQLKYVNGFEFTLDTSSTASNDKESTSFGTQLPFCIDVKQLAPEETVDVSARMRSPTECGIYQSQLRLFTEQQQPFGDPIWIVINVEANGILGITQQLTSVNMAPSSSSGATSANPPKSPFQFDVNANLTAKNLFKF